MIDSKMRLFWLVLLAACDSNDGAVPDGGFDATQDSPVEASADAPVDVRDAATTDAIDDLGESSDDAADVVDATDEDVVDASDDVVDAVAEAQVDAGGCTTNADCLIGEYCEKGVGNCNGTGSCTNVPVFCPNIVLPVCGCDGTSYNNACKAHRGLTSVDHTGNCP